MSVSGMDSLDQKLKKLSEISMRKSVEEAIRTVRSEAVNNCHADTGELQQGIYEDVTEQNGTVTGTCWTNKAYAAYVEFGTGPKGQENHVGISPEVTPAYVLSPWWIHESQVDRRVAEKYRWFFIDTPEGRFYQCTGQPAHPFMYPALHNNREKLVEDITARFQDEIEKVKR